MNFRGRESGRQRRRADDLASARCSTCRATSWLSTGQAPVIGGSGAAAMIRSFDEQFGVKWLLHAWGALLR
ncbi:MAG: hypothetical protein M5R42_04445 [Rhodocyclaceae bacterium]|nr:hypothetical protein [Rhodocyclaceae bacterium]